MQAKGSYYAFGTCVTLSLEHPQAQQEMSHTVAFLKQCEALFSANSPTSVIATINASAGIMPVTVEPLVYRLVREAILVSRRGLGFNVGIGPLVQLWRIGFDDARVPSQRLIDEALALIDPHHIICDDAKQTIFLELPGMKLDLGAIAKGYIADLIKQRWLQAGVRRGIIDLGGNILTVGHAEHADRLWRTGIQNPFNVRGTSCATIILPACSAVTSGIYERSLTSEDKTWHHIIDPRTGYPLETPLVSVTAVAASSTTAEIWSSIGFFNGPTATSTMLPNGLNTGLIFIDSQRSVRVSSSLADAFTLTDHSFQRGSDIA